MIFRVYPWLTLSLSSVISHPSSVLRLSFRIPHSKFRIQNSVFCPTPFRFPTPQFPFPHSPFRLPTSKSSVICPLSFAPPSSRPQNDPYLFLSWPEILAGRHPSHAGIAGETGIREVVSPGWAHCLRYFAVLLPL